MGYLVRIHESVRDQITGWANSLGLAEILLKRIEETLSQDTVEWIGRTPTKNWPVFRMRLADPDPASDSIYSLVFVVDDRTEPGARRIIEMTYVKYGSDGLRL